MSFARVLDLGSMMDATQVSGKTIRRCLFGIVLACWWAVITSCTNAVPQVSGPNIDFRSSVADLSGLRLSSGMLNPAFDSSETDYITMFVGASSVTVTPTAADSGASITVNGTPIVSGQPSLPIPLPFGATTITVEVRSANQSPSLSRVKTYTVVARQLVHEGYIKASNTDANDLFGYSVALSGDTLAVGARNESSAASGVNGNQLDNNAPGSGAVYVFVKDATTGVWRQEAYVKSSFTRAGNAFGASVALSGDTLVVGAPDDPSSGFVGGGTVYVFTRTNGVWTQQARLIGSFIGEGGDAFGHSVAISGETIVVGAPSDSIGITGRDRFLWFGTGAVYVFMRSGTSWAQQAYLKASNRDLQPGTSPIERFGASVALSGNTLAIGAPDEDGSATGVNGNQADNSAPGSGAVYVFTRAGGAWSQQAYVKASNTNTSDQFGSSVALVGDVLVVGAPGEDSLATGVNPGGIAELDDSAAESGAVYVFSHIGGVWSQHSYLKASNMNAGDEFGRSLSLDGTVLVVGARGEDSQAYGVNPGTGAEADNSASNSGAIYVFTQSSGLWRQDVFVKAPNTTSNYEFGWSVAVSGDTLAVGSIGESASHTGVIDGSSDDTSAPNSGAVYVYR